MGRRRNIVVIGGSAAGPKAAARARRLDQNAQITIIQKEPDLSMASCGYPYYVGGFFNERTKLLSTGSGILRNPDYYLNTKGILAKPLTEATTIDCSSKKVTCRNVFAGNSEFLVYDKLIIATGSITRMPDVHGRNLNGVTTLKSISDADFLRRVRDEGKVRRAVVIGAGLIGIETSEVLQMAGIRTTVVELLPQILSFLDTQLASLIEGHIREKGASVITNMGVTKFLGKNGSLVAVKLTNGMELPCELAVIATGVSPNVGLARNAGLRIGKAGGIVVDRYMQTSDPDIYAAGDCTEQYHLIIGRNRYVPYGDLANLQGRVAGENAVVGNEVTFPGTIQSGICKVFDYAAGATGLTEDMTKELGYDDTTAVIYAGLDKPGFMNGKTVISKMIVDNRSQKIIGFQCVGPGDVSKQVAQAAIAIQGGMAVKTLVNLDLPYAPPFAQAIDSFIACAHVMENKIKGRMRGITAEDVIQKLNRGDDMFLLDVRTPGEFEALRLGIGETLIPLGELRKRLNELPKHKTKEIIVYCKTSLRAYEAERIIEAHGWNNVAIMEGGIVAWTHSRAK
ncbi:MAG TPA: FAD-dependent oxidoreductase [Syntrophorhabdaceae bacterium]|nr:FAD-dependent oxidoreductase [Syntrophorhabdaceae bacterium]